MSTKIGGTRHLRLYRCDDAKDLTMPFPSGIARRGLAIAGARADVSYYVREERPSMRLYQGSSVYLDRTPMLPPKLSTVFAA